MIAAVTPTSTVASVICARAMRRPGQFDAVAEQADGAEDAREGGRRR
jgi:hypothetical protein